MKVVKYGKILMIVTFKSSWERFWYNLKPKSKKCPICGSKMKDVTVINPTKGCYNCGYQVIELVRR
jgi:hypothetical protein